MALKPVNEKIIPAYLALSSDIQDNGTILGATLIGKTVYLTDTGDWKIILPNLKLVPFSLSNGTSGVLPEYDSSEIGTVANDTVVLTFSEDIVAPDYALGFTIKINGEVTEILSATRQTNHAVIHFVIAEATSTDVLTIEYDSLIGGISSEVGSVYLEDMTPNTITNNIA